MTIIRVLWEKIRLKVRQKEGNTNHCEVKEIKEYHKVGNRKRFKEKEMRKYRRSINNGRGKWVVQSASLKGQTQKERENEMRVT